MKTLAVLFVFFFFSGASASAQGGSFVDAVSSASYSLSGGNPPVLSFFDETSQVRLNTRKSLRPRSDAVTAATYTFVKSPSQNRAIYKNGSGVFIGFIAEGKGVKKTAPANSEAKVDFNAIEGIYTK